MQFVNNFIYKLLAKIQEAREENGQTLVEYGLILALISIVAIAALSLIGDEVTAVFESVGNTLGDANTP